MFMMAPVGPPGIGPPLPPHQQFPNPAFNQFPPPTPPLPPPQQFQQPPPTAPFFNLTMLNQQPPHQQFHPQQRGVFGPAGIQTLTTYAHPHQQQHRGANCGCECFILFIVDWYDWSDHQLRSARLYLRILWHSN